MIGVTREGLEHPVMFDPNLSSRLNYEPGVLITGSPGSGKTFLGQMILAQASAAGKVGLCFDPKGDFKNLVPLSEEGEIGKTEVWSVVKDKDTQFVDRSNYGLLDPTRFTNDVQENIQLTIDMIENLSKETLTPNQRSAVSIFAGDVIKLDPMPSLGKVIHKLRSCGGRDGADEIRALGQTLITTLEAKLARLLTSDGRKTVSPFCLTDQIIVVDLSGLSLPDINKKRIDYSANERISIIILGMLCSLAVSMMEELPKKIPKIFEIDEAWMLMATRAGRSTVGAVSRLGRSMQTATILLTQSSKTIFVGNNSDLKSMISTRFAFFNKDMDENVAACTDMGVNDPARWANWIGGIRALSVQYENLGLNPYGFCLMNDIYGRVAPIQIIETNERWAKAFNTNPVQVKE